MIDKNDINTHIYGLFRINFTHPLSKHILISVNYAKMLTFVLQKTKGNGSCLALCL